MRIAVDGRAFASPAAGVRRYLTELTSAVSRIDPDCRFVAIGAPASSDLPAGVDRSAAAPSAPSNLGWALTGLPASARRVAFDVFHAPAYTAPLWGVRPLVVTIHDVSYARRPEWYPHANDVIRRAFYRTSATRADRIITDSAFSRSEIVEAYQIPAERITVIPLAPAALFTPDRRVQRLSFVLHVGDLHPRRNLAMLLDVIIDLRRREPGCASLELVLAGADRGVLAGLIAQAARAGAAEAVRHVGRPDDAALAVLYRQAGAFAYPSRYEGFGLPPLEAMACGAPVVMASTGATREVAGATIAVADVDDRRAWREALGTLLMNPEAARRAEGASLARAAEFSWDRTAAATIDVYRQAIRDRAVRPRA